MADDFAHLHVHSEYSLLDGYSPVKQLVKHAAKLGMSSLALTDHGNLYGAIEFYEACKDAGVKPIVGVETYMAPGKMTARGTQEREYNHLILLAQDEVGYRNLLQLVTKSWLEGYYYKPRIDRDLLAECNAGLIALSACLAGEPAAAILKEDPRGARTAAAWYREVFGDRYYIELQQHGLKEDGVVTPELVRIARELDIPLVCTNDNHYTTKDQAPAQDLLLCVQTNSTLEDPKRMRMEPPEFYLKSPAEMAALFAELPDAVSNTLAIAERCNLALTFGRLNFPSLDHVVPKGEDVDSFLARVCRERLPERYPNPTQEIRDRLEYELDVIRTTGFSAYMLFVWDFVSWARQRGIPAGPRGSAAGSIVLYLLGVADVDPIEYGLTFERFLNPERIQMPDVDMDFADERRDEVINYCIERYGRDHVAQMVTFGRLLPRAAIRDVGRVLSYPINEVDRVAKLIPTIPVGMKMDQALEQVKELKQMYDSDPAVRRLVDAARSVEGVARHASTHAAGVVVAADPLVHHTPLQRIAKNDTMVMTQYSQKSLEKIGLLKMDFLGLANLSMLEKAVRYVEETRGQKIDLQKIPLDDALTFQKLSAGETHSIFQLEGGGMTRYVKELKPQTIRHLAAMVALYRPGPMAHIPTYIARKEGRQPVEYPDPSLEELLEESYGIIVYQDQVLQIVQKVAGYSLGQADILRRAMGKKDPEVMRNERARFLDGARERGYSREIAEKLWEWIEPFAGYAFNKCVVGSTVLRDVHGRLHRVDELAKNPPPNLTLHSVTTGGEVVCNRFIEAFPTGRKPVFLITTKRGRVVTCTEDHKFLTPDGTYKPLFEIGVRGQLIAAAQGGHPAQQADDAGSGGSDPVALRLRSDGSAGSRGSGQPVQDTENRVRRAAQAWGSRPAPEPHRLLSGLMLARGLFGCFDGTAADAAPPAWLARWRWLHRERGWDSETRDLLRHRTPRGVDRRLPGQAVGSETEDTQADGEHLPRRVGGSARRCPGSGIPLRQRDSVPRPEIRAVPTLQERDEVDSLCVDEIESIQYVGVEETYNLTMAEPHHNYVLANGLVTANSHAFCYAFIAYQTGYLKANFPVEWMAAVLTTDALKTDKVVSAVGECRRLGIPLLRPDVNKSQPRFTVERLPSGPMEFKLGIRYGLAAVKNVGEGAVESIIAERERGGPFRSLEDFCGRVDLRTANKRVIEALVKCGAMDDFGPRERVLAGIDQCMSAGQQRQKAAGVGQTSLFDLGGEEEPAVSMGLPQVAPIAQREKLAWEKESLGLYLSDHPFQEAARWLAPRLSADSSQLGPEAGSEPLTLAGVVSGIKRITTKKGDAMVVAQLEDLHGSFEVVAFPRTYAQTAEAWREDAVLIVTGKVDTREDRNQVLADAVEEWAAPEGGEAPPEAAATVAAPSSPFAVEGVAWAPAASSGQRNGNGHANGSVRANGTGGGNGNGGNAAAEVIARLRLVLRRTDDDEADIRTLWRLRDLLQEDGESPYVVVVALADGRWRVSSEDCHTRFSPDLEQRLRTLLGDEHVEVEQL